MSAVNTIAMIQASIGEADDRASQPHVGLRRTMHTGYDAVIRVPTPSASHAGGLPELARILEKHPAILRASAKRGQIALNVTDEHIANQMEDIVDADGATLEAPKRHTGQQWVVDLFDPTATKAMHIGHLRNVALGTALAGLGEAHGATLTYQSVVGDMGRSIAEAISGYLTDFSPSTPASCGVKSDHFVGQCYARYVSRVASLAGDLPSADQPIAREVCQLDDSADQIVKEWLAENSEIRNIWNELIAWVMSGHEKTLEACGLAVPNSIMESDYFDLASELISKGLASGLLARSDDNRVSYPTGRMDYASFPLLRQDGLPNQHLRTIATWAAVLTRGGSQARWLHILGDEWRISTECRLDLLKKLGYHERVDRYVPVFHGMVTGNGSKLSSSEGDAILVDDEIARLASVPRLKSLAEEAELGPFIAARMILCALLLSVQPRRPLQYSSDAVLDPQKNPGIVLLEALARSLADIERNIAVYTTQSPEVRYLVLRSQLLPTMMSMSWQRFDPQHVLTYLVDLAQVYGQTARCALLARVMRRILLSGFAAIGLIGNQQLRAAP
jgi:arginyl-tRNA synthetase